MNKAILITYDKEDAINEAKGLCEAAGYEVLHIIPVSYTHLTLPTILLVYISVVAV